MFKLALIQMLVEGGARERNLARACERIREAAAQGAQVVLLPEVLDLGWTHPSSQTQAEPIPEGRACAALRQAARDLSLYVCAGLSERAGEQVYNSAVLIDPGGTVRITHRKLNELEIGHGCYAQGDRLAVAHTPLGTIGVMICADALSRQNVILQTLGYMGAELVLSPSAWAVPPAHDNGRNPYGQTWRDAYKPPARDFRMWIASASNVGLVPAGAWKGWHCIGCSLVVDSDGREVLQGPYGLEAETILYADVRLEPRPARGGAWQDLWSKAERK